MNWKTTFILLIASAVVTFTIPLITSGVSTSVGLISLGVRALIYLPIFLFAFELNKAVTERIVTNQLKVFQNLSYVAVVLLILGVIATMFTMVSGAFKILYYYDSFLFFMSLVAIITQIVLITMLFKSYQMSKEVGAGSYAGPRNDSDILDDFEIEDEELASYSPADRIKLCQVCTKRKFNPQVGVVCSLTDAKPEFIDHCADYLADEKALVLQGKTSGVSQENTDMDSGIFGNWRGAILMSVLGFVRAAMKGFDDPFGLIFLGLGVLWLIIALAAGSEKK